MPEPRRTVPSLVAKHPFDVEPFPGDVHRVRLAAQVGDVDVIVVTDQPAVANRPQQGPVADERRKPGHVAQRAQQLFDLVEELRHRVGGFARQRPRQSAVLVQDEPVAVGVDDAHGAARVALEDVLSGGQDALLRVIAQDDIRLAHEVAPQRLGPRSHGAAELGIGVPARMQRPHMVAVEQDVVGALGVDGAWEVDPVVVDHQWLGAGGRLGDAHGRPSSSSLDRSSSPR